MKKVKRLTVAILVLLAASNMQAKTLNKSTNGIFCIEDSSKIRIKDVNNNIIFAKEVSSNTISNLSEYLPILGKGQYVLEIEDGFSIQVKPFSIQDERIAFVSESSYVIFKPVITTNGKTLHLSQHLSNVESLEVKIFDHYGQLLYNEGVKDESQLDRVYDFSEVKENNIRIVLKSNKRTFSETVKF